MNIKANIEREQDGLRARVAEMIEHKQRSPHESDSASTPLPVDAQTPLPVVSGRVVVAQEGE